MVKENKATDLVLGLHQQHGISDTFLGKLTEGILKNCNITTFIYKNVQPISTISQYLVIIPKDAEKEMGFAFWLLRMWNIGVNTGAKLVFYGSDETISYIKQVPKMQEISVQYVPFEDWEDFLIISRDLKSNDALVVILSRKNGVSYDSVMKKLPKYLNNYFQMHNYLLVYPMQEGFDTEDSIDSDSLLSPSEQINSFKNTVGRLFGRK